MLCKKINYILAFFTLVLCQTAFAWEKYKTYDIWIDKDSIYTQNIKGNKFVNIWAMRSYPKPNNEGYKSTKSLRTIDCNERRVSAVYHLYSQPQGGGKELNSDYQGPTSIEPDTFDNELLKDFCKVWWKFW